MAWEEIPWPQKVSGSEIDNNIRKWVCRLYFSANQKTLQFRDGEKVQLQGVQDIEQFKDKLSAITTGLLGSSE